MYNGTTIYSAVRPYVSGVDVRRDYSLVTDNNGNRKMVRVEVVYDRFLGLDDGSERSLQNSNFSKLSECPVSSRLTRRHGTQVTIGKCSEQYTQSLTADHIAW